MNYEQAIEYLDLRTDDRGEAALSVIELTVEDLRAALIEILAAREMKSRIGLWPIAFPHIGRSAKEPKSAARNRFEIWYTRATCRVIKAEEQARILLEKNNATDEAESP